MSISVSEFIGGCKLHSSNSMIDSGAKAMHYDSYCENAQFLLKFSQLLGRKEMVYL